MLNLQKETKSPGKTNSTHHDFEGTEHLRSIEEPSKPGSRFVWTETVTKQILTTAPGAEQLQLREDPNYWLKNDIRCVTPG